MTTATKTTRGALVIDEAIRHQVQLGETASNYEVLMLQPGTYPFTLTEIGGGPWVPGRNSPGYVKPGGPYYAKAEIEAVQVETYIVNRLFAATSSHREMVHRPTKYITRLYAYELYSRKTLFGSQARIELPQSWREDTYRCIARLEDKDYDRVLSRAIGWLAKHNYGDYSKNPHYHVWNQVEANAVAGIEGYVKAVMEGY